MNREEREKVAIIKIKQAEVIAKLSEETIKSILNKYEVLASIESKENTEEVLYNNAGVYSIILLPIMYRVLYNIVGGTAYNKFKNSVPKIDKVLTDKNGRDKFFAKYGRKLVEKGVQFNEYEELSEEKIVNILSTFGIEYAEQEDNIDIIEDEDLDFELDLDGEEETSDEEEVAEDEDGNSLKELKNVWGDKVDLVVSGIMSTYRRLYESGYGLVSPCGVLTNAGAIRSTTDGRIIQSGNKALDMELFRAITSVLKDNYNLYAENDREPDIYEIERAGQPVIYVGMHLRFMFGHIRFCKGINSYLSKHNINNESTTKVIKWGDMSGYIREKVEEYFYTAYIKYGVTCEASENDIQITNKINAELSKNLKNVIILAERNKGINTRVRIASDTNINVDSIINVLNSSLNVGTDNGINVRQVGEYKDGVLDINVVYNERKFSQDTLFAYQVLDKLNEQGIRPRWDNVILGKKDDGTIMTYNFKDKRNAVYAIYASTGAGKGVMTLNLIASAIADLCKVLYIDGKPDMGEVLADIAWKNGVEAPVYNGVSGKGHEMLENRGTSARAEDPLGDKENIPKDIFITEQEYMKFMLITTYLRGIELICDVAAYRSSQDLPGSDWVTAFVDECEQASVAEIDVMECLDRAETNRKAMKGPDGKKLNTTEDEVLQFIRTYRQWQQSIKSKFKTCITSTFRYSNMTIMFIWQSTKFPEQYKNKSIIASVIDASAGVITKIFGKGAAVAYGSQAFGTPTSLDKATWYDGRFTSRGGGYFAIGKDVTSNSMQVFRPFNIYSDANHKELIVENAKAAGISEDDLKGVSLDNMGNVIPEVGFEGYITKMLVNYGVTIDEQLNASYKYFDTFIKSNGVFSNLNKYMFDCHTFNSDSQGEKNRYFKNKITIEQDTGDTDETGWEKKETEKTGGGKPKTTIDFNEAGVGAEGYEEVDYEEDEYHNEINSENNKRINEYREGMKQIHSARGKSDFIPETKYVNANVGVELANGRVIISDNSGFKAIDIDSSDYVEPYETQANILQKFTGKIIESNYGMNYNFKQRWKFILDAISNSFPRDNMVVRVQVLYDMILVNSKIVNINNMMDNDYGIMLEDIVNFSELFRRFRNIKELSVDQESFRWLTREFSGSKVGVYEAFRIAKVLQVIKISDFNNDNYEIRRDGSNSDSVVKKQQKEEFRQQIDQASAGYNSRVKQKGSVYMDRISRGSFGFTKSNWGHVKNNFKETKGKRHIIRGTLWLGLVAVTGTIGGIFLGGNKLMTAFGK